jgi:sugar-specific transcriptional regulator TrmB
MDTFELLTKTGLSKKEAAIYTALLEHGTMSMSEISKETHINRPALYQLLPKMKKDGLVSAVQKQKRYFYRAESPSRLLEHYKTEHAEIAEKLTALITEQEYLSHDRPLIKYFEGDHGVRFVFDDVAHTLPRGATFYRYSSRVGNNTKAFDDTYYVKARETKQLQRLVISSEEKAGEKVKKLERSIKAVPKEFDLFEDNIALVIYANKTAYIDYASKTAFIVESEKIARFQEKLFKLLYKKL